MTFMFLMSMFAYAYAFITSNFALQHSEPPVHFNGFQLLLIAAALIIVLIGLGRKRRKK